MMLNPHQFFHDLNRKVGSGDVPLIPEGGDTPTFSRGDDQGLEFPEYWKRHRGHLPDEVLIHPDTAAELQYDGAAGGENIGTNFLSHVMSHPEFRDAAHSHKNIWYSGQRLQEPPSGPISVADFSRGNPRGHNSVWATNGLHIARAFAENPGNLHARGSYPVIYRVSPDPGHEPKHFGISEDVVGARIGAGTMHPIAHGPDLAHHLRNL